MTEHFDQVAVIRDAVIRGALDETRGPARWLSTHDHEEFPAVARPSLDAMQNEARIMLAQDQVVDVGRSLARMGVACGRCHSAMGEGPNFQVTEPPALSPNPEPHMIRHKWAMDRMWEGLTGPSNTSWMAGAGALQDMPLEFDNNDQAEHLAQRVHELSKKALTVTGDRDRAQLYGDLLETCALCHATLKMRMK